MEVIPLAHTVGVLSGLTLCTTVAARMFEHDAMEAAAVGCTVVTMFSLGVLLSGITFGF